METLSGAEILVFWRYKYLCQAFRFVKKKLDSQTEALMMRYYYRVNKSMPINQFLKLPTVFFLVQLCKKLEFYRQPLSSLSGMPFHWESRLAIYASFILT